MKKKNKTKIIGYCAVDSGQIMLIDPCYLSYWKDTESDDKNAQEESYATACKLTLSKEQAGQIGDCYAVVTTSGYGDGCYPVYASYQEGRIKSVTIKFF